MAAQATQDGTPLDKLIKRDGLRLITLRDFLAGIEKKPGTTAKSAIADIVAGKSFASFAGGIGRRLPPDRRCRRQDYGRAGDLCPPGVPIRGHDRDKQRDKSGERGCNQYAHLQARLCNIASGQYRSILKSTISGITQRCKPRRRAMRFF